MSQTPSRCITVSASGKVLIAGGYLVLERPNSGMTVATNSRFHTTIGCKSLNKRSSDLIEFAVESPQFHSEYSYSYSFLSGVLVNNNDEQNDFIQKCLELTLSFIVQYFRHRRVDFKSVVNEVIGMETNTVSIKVRADNDFYSQITELQKMALPLLSTSLRSLPRFMQCPKDESSGKVTIAKTGLGSSAALTTSLVGAVLHWFRVVDLRLPTATQQTLRDTCPLPAVASAEADAAAVAVAVGNKELSRVLLSLPDRSESLRLVHNLAQLVHANAQGKIGSGFDVAAAVYGTQVYVRFSPEAFAPCLESNVDPDLLYRAVTAQHLSPPGRYPPAATGESKERSSSTPADCEETESAGAEHRNRDSASSSAERNASRKRQLDEEPTATDTSKSEITRKSSSSSSSSSDSSSGGSSSGREVFVWDQSVTPMSLPAGLGIVLGDVCGGSSSTSMARTVLQWRKQCPEAATALWHDLAGANQAVIAALRELHALHKSSPEEYCEQIQWAAKRKSCEWESEKGEKQPVVAQLIALRSAVILARKLLKQMGQAAGQAVGVSLEIEPDAQTDLADATQSEVPGVVCCGVPGAGGVDAVFALYLYPPVSASFSSSSSTSSSSSSRAAIEALWSTWHQRKAGNSCVCPLMLSAACEGSAHMSSSGCDGGDWCGDAGGVSVSPEISW